MDIDEKNKKLEELLTRNQNIFDDFVSNVSKVDIVEYSWTFKEKYDYEENTKDQRFPLSKELFEPFGLKAFIKYGEIVIDCINKTANNENRKDIIFKEDEILNHNKWIERVNKTKNGDDWIYFYNSLFGCVSMTHDARVKMIRDKRIEDFNNKELLKQKSEHFNHSQFLENFIKDNEEFINLFLKDVKEKENKKDSFGLNDKTLFEKEAGGFLDKLSKHHGYKSISETEGYYRGFDDDFKKQLEIMYKKVD